MTIVRLLVVALFVCALCTPSARADGDPASDVLYAQRMFVPADASFPRPAEQQLLALLAASARAGYPIKVAVIPSSYDLGSVGALWGKPRRYALFLGIELSLAFHGRLLVVMPAGLGVYHAGKAVAEERRALAGLKIGSGPGGLAPAAIDAVRRLAAAGGHPLTPTRPAPSRKTGHSTDAPRLAVAAAAVCLLASLLWLSRHRLTRRRRPPRKRGLTPSRPFWIVLSLIVLCALAADVALLRTRTTHAADSIAALPTTPSTTWPTHTRTAPHIELVDAEGRPLAKRIGNGRTTIVTFIDPLCRNLCPLEAQVLNRATQAMPAAQRPQILAVSVNPQADTRANFRLDTRRWHLVPEWTWATGSRAQLATVWRDYLIDVQTIVQRAAGITVRKIVHTEASYIIDGQGYTRALYLWPYSAKAVTATLRSLADETPAGRRP